MNEIFEIEHPPQVEHQDDFQPIDDPLLKLNNDLKLLREKWGCNDGILKFDYVNSESVENEDN